MKKTIFTLILAVATFTFGYEVNAQIQKGNVMIGGSVANLDLGLNSGGNTTFSLTPKAGWFIQDGLVIGAQALFGVTHTSGSSSDVINYGVGGFGRYYITDKNIELTKKSKFFFEADLGIQGQNQTKGGGSTNGLGFGFGPGLAYFVTPNIGLETSLKYNGIVGFGSEAFKNNLLLSIGFQIYLPHTFLNK